MPYLGHLSKPGVNFKLRLLRRQANITLSRTQMVTQSRKHACFPEQEIEIGHIAVPLNREVQNPSRITASLTDVVPVKLTCVFSFTGSRSCGT